jgi:hypothetical protein
LKTADRDVGRYKIVEVIGHPLHFEEAPPMKDGATIYR